MAIFDKKDKNMEKTEDIVSAQAEPGTIEPADTETPNHKQSFIPDFEALAATENNFSEGAVPPPVMGGLVDASASESASPVARGRPALSPEERAARKKARDKARRDAAKGKTAPVADPDAPVSPDTQATAELVVGSLDLILGTVSNGEFAADDKVRSAYVTVWSKYLHTTGASLPPWAEVTIMSAVYAAPVLRSPTTRERLGFGWMRLKTWLTGR